ncbi:MAG: hypothetical protein Athens071426_37 [Parcubacteria group bacterium Athens0714_26]|nr:MAG: hypothetical protein Athens101426_205 [Parcubacteria group bacterium Athens1014_26]TSD03830.1 MAG: hypothetical protein Athens071426_37 [Parcubacteria group bacterium Athens0714_26]
MKKLMFLAVLVVSVLASVVILKNGQKSILKYDQDPVVWAHEHNIKIVGWRIYEVQSAAESTWDLAETCSVKTDTRLLVDIIVSKNKLKNSLYAGQQVLLPIIN